MRERQLYAEGAAHAGCDARVLIPFHDAGITDHQAGGHVSMAERTIRDNPEESRYEAYVDGELAGVADYMIANRLVVFTHTDVDPKFEGKGVGSALVKHALDDVRADGSQQVLPLCPFVKVWMGRHPAYQDLVFAAQPSRVTD